MIKHICSKCKKESEPTEKYADAEGWCEIELDVLNRAYCNSRILLCEECSARLGLKPLKVEPATTADELVEIIYRLIDERVNRDT